MHPEILRQLTEQRGREMRAQARHSRLVRMAIRGRRHGHDLPDDDFVIPADPDYVDGTFRTDHSSKGPAVEQVSGESSAARPAA